MSKISVLAEEFTVIGGHDDDGMSEEAVLRENSERKGQLCVQVPESRVVQFGEVTDLLGRVIVGVLEGADLGESAWVSPLPVRRQLHARAGP